MNQLLASETVISYLCDEYALDHPVSASLIRRGFNDTYLVAADEKKMVFRIYFRDKYYIAGADDFRWELGLLDHLHGAGVPVCPAIWNKSGETLGTIADSGGERSCALFPMADGEPLPKEDVALAAKTGEITARLHAASDGYRTEYHRYQFDLRYLAEQPLELIDQFLKEHGRAGVDRYRPSIAEQKALICAIGRDTPVYGPIHGDLNRGNVLATADGAVTPIDFDHSGYGWRAFDVATCTRGMLEPARQAFIESYERVRRLTAAEHGAMEAFRKIRPIWDMGDFLEMRVAWDNYDEFGAEYADKIEDMLEKQFG